MAMDYIFFVQVTLTKIANTLLERSAALVLSIINLMHCSCTAIWQIRPEIWAKPDLTGFQKNGQIPDLPEPEPN